MVNLPYPLTGKELETAISEYKNGVDDARDRLVEGNLRLIVHICKRYENQVDLEDLFQVGVIGFLRGLSSNCPDTASAFSSHISMKVTEEIETFLKANGKYI